MHSRQGTRLCKSCENPPLNAPSSVCGCKAKKAASPGGSQPFSWVLPGGNHCWHPWALHTEINSALSSWLKSSPAAPDISCRNQGEEEAVGGGHSVAPTWPLNTLGWAFRKRWVLLGSGEKSAVKQSLKVTCSDVMFLGWESPLRQCEVSGAPSLPPEIPCIGLPLSPEAEYESFPAVSSLPFCYQRQGLVPMTDERS